MPGPARAGPGIDLQGRWGRGGPDRAEPRTAQPPSGSRLSHGCGKVLATALLGALMQYSRDVAQFGSALDWGSRGRGFKSRRPDRAVAGHREVRRVADLFFRLWWGRGRTDRQPTS